MAVEGTCPLSQERLIEDHFMEQRNHVLAVAAFLDRMDRSIQKDGEDDFRMVALREALVALSSGDAHRAERVQMIFSDPDTDLLDERDQQGAYGASARQGEEGGPR